MPTSTFSLDLAAYGIEYLADDSLINCINQLSAVNQQLNLENQVFESYLVRMQPELVVGLQQAIELLEIKENRLHAVASLMNQRPHAADSVSGASTASFSHGSFAPSHASMSRTHVSGPALGFVRDIPRIEVAHKAEMASRETEELKKSTGSYRNTTRIAKADLNATIEGLRLVKKDIKLFSEEFELRLLKEYTNTRVPAERYVRFVEAMIKEAESEITKIKLKTQALMLLGRRVQVRLLQKRELGGTLRPVDYKMLKIETEEKLIAMERLSHNLFQLKGASAKSKSQLINMKNTLVEQEGVLCNVNDAILSCEALIKRVVEKNAEVCDECKASAEQLRKIKALRRELFVPDTMEYLKVKAEVSSLKKEIKMWTRKNHIQHATLVTYKNRIRMLARRKKVGDNMNKAVSFT